MEPGEEVDRKEELEVKQRQQEARGRSMQSMDISLLIRMSLSVDFFRCCDL